MNGKDGVLARLWTSVQRSFSEFLFIPSAQVLFFTLFAGFTCTLDAAAGSEPEWGPFRLFLDRFVGDTSQATDLLSTVATSLVTVSSITFSILLLAVQQSSAALTNQVVDQYLRRRSNQWFFGFFVGSSVYALTCLGLTRNEAVPVYATVVSLLLAIACLMSLVILIYSTLDQTRPSSIISSIHDTALRARCEHAKMISLGREFSEQDRQGTPIRSEAFGYVTWIDAEKMCKTADDGRIRSIAVPVSVGEPVYVGQPIAIVDAGERPLGKENQEAIRRAVHIERRRDLRYDPCYGVDQLSDIGWTAISTAKSNPAAAHVACHALNDLLYQWSRQGCLIVADRPESRVALKDRLVDHLAAAFESLMVVTSESMQHQSLAVVLNGITDNYGALVPPLQDKLEDALLNNLSALGDQVPTMELAEAIDRLKRSLDEAEKTLTAKKFEHAWAHLATVRGRLHARSDRATAWKNDRESCD